MSSFVGRALLKARRVRYLFACVPFLFWTPNNVRIDEGSKRLNEICPMDPLTRIPSVNYIDQMNEIPTGALVLLHGSCGTGHDFYETIKTVLGEKGKFPHIKMIIPNAPRTRYTPLGGAKVPTWFDISGFTMEANENDEDIQKVMPDIIKIIEHEVRCGIPLHRIVVGGFSRGGGMSFHIGYRFLKGLAGIGVMSSFLPTSSQVYKELKHNRNDLPLLFQQQGNEDTLVDHRLAENTFEILKKLGVQGEYKSYPQLGHEVSRSELKDFLRFVLSVIPDDVIVSKI